MAMTITEPPVPHGLDSLPGKSTALLEFFEADRSLIDAAALGIPSSTRKTHDRFNQCLACKDIDALERRSYNAC